MLEKLRLGGLPRVAAAVAMCLAAAVPVLGLSMCLSGCTKAEDPKAVIYKPVPPAPEVIAAAGTEERVAPAIAIRGTVVYAAWAQERVAPNLTGAHDIYFASAGAGAALATNGAKISTTTDDAVGPSVAVSEAGDVTVAWMEGALGVRSIKFATRQQGASQFTAGVLADGSATTSDNANPHVHYDSAANLHFVWEVNGEIHYRRQPAGGGAFGTAITLPMGTATGASAPTITSDDGNNIMVVFEANEVINTVTYRLLRVAASESGGVTFNKLGRLGVPPLSQGLYEPKAAAINGTGGLVVAYRIGTTGERRIRVSRFTNLGAQLAHSRDMKIDAASTVREPAVATQYSAGDNEIWASWVEAGEIQVRVSLDNGDTFGPIAEYSAGKGVAATARRPVVAIAGNSLIVAWDAQDSTSLERELFVTRTDVANR
jgi:hypothetical protein